MQKNRRIFNAYGYCKHEGCGEYTFSIYAGTEKNKEISVHVEKTSNMNNEKNESVSLVKYCNLKTIQTEVEDENKIAENKSDTYYFILLKRLHKLQEKLFVDITFKSKHVEGYIQHFGSHPFELMMFCYEQIHYLLQLSKQERVVCYFSNANLITSDFRNIDLKYWALVTYGSQSSRLHLLDIISTNNESKNLTFFLYQFLYSIKSHVHRRKSFIAIVKIHFELFFATNMGKRIIW